MNQETKSGSEKREIKIIKEREIWENFLLDCREKTFLDSWNWGEFQKMIGNKIWRLGIFKGAKLLSVALVIKITAKRGTFLFLPHGPVVQSTTGNLKSQIQNLYPPKFSKKTWEGEQIPNLKYQILNILLEKLKKIAKEEKVSFIRISPIWERTEENIKIFKRLGFRKAPIHIHPELTWELDIKPPEEELLANMRKTTRYLIRKGLKNKDIEILESQKVSDIEIFNKLYHKVVIRHHFIPFSLDYLKNEFLAFQPNQVLLLLGKYKGETVGSGIFVIWQNIAFYHHGASSLKYPKIPVSYLLLWRAIKEAKKRNCHFFNFWGIAPDIDLGRLKRHPWAGLTLFKMGFGGYKKEYLKTQDFPLSNKYWLTFLFEKLRKTKRGL